jgi:hypothetical protein
VAVGVVVLCTRQWWVVPGVLCDDHSSAAGQVCGWFIENELGLGGVSGCVMGSSDSICNRRNLVNKENKKSIE